MDICSLSRNREGIVNMTNSIALVGAVLALNLVCGCSDERVAGNAAGTAGSGGTAGSAGTAGAAGSAATSACDAQDATPEGDCDLVLGTSWDGLKCIELSGCSCQGADCDQLYQPSPAFPTGTLSAFETCEKARRGCSTCEPQDAVFLGNCAFFDPTWSWDGQQCVAAEMFCSCEGTDCTTVFSDQSACELAHAACS